MRVISDKVAKVYLPLVISTVAGLYHLTGLIAIPNIFLLWVFF